MQTALERKYEKLMSSKRRAAAEWKTKYQRLRIKNPSSHSTLRQSLRLDYICIAGRWGGNGRKIHEILATNLSCIRLFSGHQTLPAPNAPRVIDSLGINVSVGWTMPSEIA